jgi:uncharacterized membrane protein YraQ (UPF0718 family)
MDTTMNKTSNPTLGKFGQSSSRGFSLPIINILIVIIAVLTYFYGWSVLFYVLGIVASVTIGTLIYDRFTSHTRPSRDIIKPRWHYTRFLVTRSAISKESIVKILEESLQLPSFVWKEKSNWQYSYSEDENLGINVTKASDFSTIETWITGTPAGANIQIIIYSNKSQIYKQVCDILRQGLRLDLTYVDTDSQD